MPISCARCSGFRGSKALRRIRYQDLLDYKGERDRESQQALDALTREAQELEIGYSRGR